MDVTTAKELDFYPNSCPICQGIEKLKRCSRCNMISYCGKEHQLQHWPSHKEFCNVISAINKEQNISHLYQKFQGLDWQSWKLQADLLASEVERRLIRDMNFFEMKVLLFPRVCCVCYEAKQELLRKCPGCPAASFCQKHPTSSLHDQDCHKVKKIHEIFKEVDLTKKRILLQNLLPILTSIQIDESSKLPLSIEEFFCQFVKPKMDLTTNELIFLSNILNVQLTTFNALKILDYSDSDLVVYIEDVQSSIKDIDNIGDTLPYWEVLLHLLPHLRNIRIEFLNEDFCCEMDIKLCKKCNLSKKKIILEWKPLTGFEYMEMYDFEKPNIFLSLNAQPEDLDNEILISWQKLLARSRKMNFPLVFTSKRETEPIEFRKILKSTFGNFRARYDGINKFGSLTPFRHFDDGIYLLNHFLIVIDPPESQKLENCKCGMTRCKIRKDDPKYEQLCSKFSMAFESSKIRQVLQFGITAEPGMDINKFNSIDEFLDSFYNEFTQKIIFSNLHTRPLTLVYALEKLGFMVDSKMVIHVIGATGMEMSIDAFWMTVFFFFSRLKILKIIFIGPEVFNEDYLENYLDEDYLDMIFDDLDDVLDKVSLKVECHALRYDEYCKSDSFEYPNLIAGFNLSIHESESGISECTWKDTIIALSNLKAPFVLTAETEDRARKDHKRLCELLGNSVDYFCLKQNPFPGLIPETDFESEEILYPNQYVIVYDGLDKKQDETATEKSPNLENLENLQKLSELQISEIKTE